MLNHKYKHNHKTDEEYKKQLGKWNLKQAERDSKENELVSLTTSNFNVYSFLTFTRQVFNDLLHGRNVVYNVCIVTMFILPILSVLANAHKTETDSDLKITEANKLHELWHAVSPNIQPNFFVSANNIPVNIKEADRNVKNKPAISEQSINDKTLLSKIVKDLKAYENEIHEKHLLIERIFPASTEFYDRIVIPGKYATVLLDGRIGSVEDADYLNVPYPMAQRPLLISKKDLLPKNEIATLEKIARYIMIAPIVGEQKGSSSYTLSLYTALSQMRRDTEYEIYIREFFSKNGNKFGLPKIGNRGEYMDNKDPVIFINSFEQWQQERPTGSRYGVYKALVNQHGKPKDSAWDLKIGNERHKAITNFRKGFTKLLGDEPAIHQLFDYWESINFAMEIEDKENDRFWIELRKTIRERYVALRQSIFETDNKGDNILLQRLRSILNNPRENTKQLFTKLKTVFELVKEDSTASAMFNIFQKMHDVQLVVIDNTHLTNFYNTVPALGGYCHDHKTIIYALGGVLTKPSLDIAMAKSHVCNFVEEMMHSIDDHFGFSQSESFQKIYNEDLKNVNNKLPGTTDNSVPNDIKELVGSRLAKENQISDKNIDNHLKHLVIDVKLTTESHGDLVAEYFARIIPFKMKWGIELAELFFPKALKFIHKDVMEKCEILMSHKHGETEQHSYSMDFRL